MSLIILYDELIFTHKAKPVAAVFVIMPPQSKLGCLQHHTDLGWNQVSITDPDDLLTQMWPSLIKIEAYNELATTNNCMQEQEIAKCVEVHVGCIASY